MTPSDHEIVEQMRERSKQLESLLDDFNNRLRRMRQRNREVEQEISDFEEALGGLEDWLQELNSSED